MPTSAARRAERRLNVMGTTAHIVVLGGGEGTIEWAAVRLQELELRWSRFLEHSEVSELNRAMGQPIPVSDETLRLISVAVEAWHRTSGAFDPSVYEALVGLGYDRTFSKILPVALSPAQLPSPGCAGIEIDAERSLVRLPLGVRFDAGGIGKGLAADIVAGEVMAAGADGVLINVGGDLRTLGEGPHEGWWPVDIDEPASGVSAIRVLVHNAAMASSTTAKRRWAVGSKEVHHLIDPATGQSMSSKWSVVTALAGEAWWAEAATKALMLDGPDALPPGVSARLVGTDGSVLTLGEFERFVR